MVDGGMAFPRDSESRLVGLSIAYWRSLLVSVVATPIRKSPRYEVGGLGQLAQPSYLVSYYLLVVKDHTLAVSIWLPTRSATSAATIAL